MWNIWPYVQMDMSVPDQQEGSSPKQEDIEIRRATGRGTLTYTVYHFYYWHSKGHPWLDPWRHLWRRPGQLVLTGIRHYSTVRVKGTLRKIEQRTKTWLVKNTQGDRAADKDLAGQKHSGRSSSGQRLGWSKTLREIEQRTKTWLVKNTQGDRAVDKDLAGQKHSGRSSSGQRLDWSKTLREIE